MEKILEIKMAYWGRVLELVQNHVLVISCADDQGSQSGLRRAAHGYRHSLSHCLTGRCGRSVRVTIDIGA